MRIHIGAGAREEIEISQIDIRYEVCRLKNPGQERAVLNSILEVGIREPLQCVKKSGMMILLDGFKRLRSAAKLKIHVAPVVSLGNDEAMGIIQFLRADNEKSLSILEQAALVDELKRSLGLGVLEIARRLERSPAWVSVRLGAIGQMSSAVKEAVFMGRFPVRAYIYTLRHFTRVNRTDQAGIDNFVRAVSGKELSARSIELLAEGFFTGKPGLKEQILKGNIEWTINQLRNRETEPDNGLSEIETKTLKDMEITSSCIGRIPHRLRDKQLKSAAFFTAAEILTEGILGKISFFVKTLEEFYAQRRQKEGNTRAVYGREKEEGNSPAVESDAKDSKKNT